MTLRTCLMSGMILVLLSACSEPEVRQNGVESTDDPTPASTTIAVVSATVTDSPVTSVPEAAAPVATTAAPPTTSVAMATTKEVPPEVTLPGSFATLGELAERVHVFVDPIDAQIRSSWIVHGDERDLAQFNLSDIDWPISWTITYFGDLTVWDFGDGTRDARRSGEAMSLIEDGSWTETGDAEWGQLGPVQEWAFAQSGASNCLESDPEVVGLEDIAGLPTLHVRCIYEGDVAVEGSLDLWIGETGLVMKLVAESDFFDPSLRDETVWEVIGLDVEPAGPLPPGW